MKREFGELSRHHILWGVLLGGAVVLTIQVLTWAGLGLSHWTWILTYVLVAVFCVLGARSLGRRVGSRPRFLETALLLAVMILVSRLIYQTYMFVYIHYVDPTWVDTVAQVWSAQLAESGSSTEEIERSIATFRSSWRTSYVFSLGIISFGVAQFVVGLVAAVATVIQPWRRSGAE